jgi:hypothetical protein
MVAVHLIYDLTELYPILKLPNPRFYLMLKNWGGSVFFLISGVTVTLGHRYLRRGLTVFGCGILVSVVTCLAGMPVRFGVLQSLGCCMLLWCFFRGASPKRLLAAGIAIAAAVLRYMALYDLYASCDRNNHVIYLVLSIFLPATEAFFVFFSRNKDEGMPPRRKAEPVVDAQPVYEQEEPWMENEQE